MELLELMKYRRSIRKYQKKQIERDALQKSLKQDCTPLMPEVVSVLSSVQIRDQVCVKDWET